MTVPMFVADPSLPGLVHAKGGVSGLRVDSTRGADDAHSLQTAARLGSA